MEMSNPAFLPSVGLGSVAHSTSLEEIAVRLCLNQRTQLCPHVWVPIMKPLRPCIRRPVQQLLPTSLSSPDDPTHPLWALLDDVDDNLLTPIKNKQVVFADSRGRTLTDVRHIKEEEESCDLDLLPTVQGVGSMTEDGYSCTVSTSCPGTRFTLTFPQPTVDFQAFRGKLESNMVVLESCSVSARALWGTVRVKNIAFKKDVRVRITFDSWMSYRDVPCSYLQKRFGGPQTDIFEFSVSIPKVIDAKRRIEFCLMYLPAGYSQPFWDNNSGQNYNIAVSVGSHLSQGMTLNEKGNMFCV